MITLVLVLSFTAIILFNLANFINKKKKLAPGPIKWPIIGNFIEITMANSNYPHLALAKMAKKYGNVMGFGYGVHYSVVISGYEEMKNILTRPEVYEQRFEFPYTKERSYGKNLGIQGSYGEVWHDMRRFTIRTLRDFGWGKAKSMEILMTEETDEMIENIRSCARDNHGIWNVDSSYLSLCVINVLWSLVAGYRFSSNDENLIESLRLADLEVEVFGHDNKYNAFPFLRNWFPKLVRHDIHTQAHAQLQTFMKELIDGIKIKRLKRVDHMAQNFIEVFIDKIEKNDGNRNKNFTEEQLIIILLDLFLAGSETISMSLNWTILFLTLNPTSQQKLQNEIANNVQTLTHISLEDAAKMPYLKAVMLEVSRLGTVLPMPLPRTTIADILFQDFVIPKGTVLFSNFTPVFMDKKYWGDPHIFRPERFINEFGKIIPEHAERIAIFGFGKRKCVGELLAWNTLIMFITALFGNFTFESIQGNEPSAENPICGLTYKPRPYNVYVLPNRCGK